VGPGGEAILDLVASDALSAGFGTIVLVVGSETGPTIRDHVERLWPGDLDVRFALQATPTGTVGAVLAAWPEVAGLARFGVANADDLYGPAALSILATHLAGTDEDNALVGFRLDRSVVGRLPVTRGVCRTDDNGYLVQIDERRGVVPRDDGTFGTGDGRSPEVLDPDTLVSLNLWGFSSVLDREFEAATKHGREDEVLLPDLVGQLIAAPLAHRFRVLPTDSRCIGVTHPDDLAVVQHDVAAQVDRGERPASLWS
jgi:NDP-sugar pyrophosphorylase family protein